MDIKALLGVAVALGLSAPVEAAILVVRPPDAGLIVGVAEGCGPGFWRGPAGYCHPPSRLPGRLSPWS